MLHGEDIVFLGRQERRGACVHWATCSVCFKETAELLGQFLSLDLWVSHFSFQFFKYLQADGEPLEAYSSFSLNSRFDYFFCSRKRCE